MDLNECQKSRNAMNVSVQKSQNFPKILICLKVKLNEKYLFLVIDANAKLPSGILNGNLNQLGDFDECLSVVARNNDFHGKYCLVNVQLSLPKKFKHLNHLRKIVLANEAYESDFDDVKMF